MLSLAEVEQEAWRLLAPARALDCWSWNQRYHYVPEQETAKPGLWSAESVPYWRHWHQIMTARLTMEPLAHDPHAHQTEQIWIVAGAQTRKTRSILQALLLWAIDAAPRSMGYVLKRKQDVRKVQRMRVLPTFRQSPRLSAHLPQSEKEKKERMSAASWQLARSDVHWLNASVAEDLRQFPLELMLLDEFDNYPLNLHGEGDPIELCLARQLTYQLTRLLIGVSTPTELMAHGWNRLCSGSHERLMVPCQHCGGHFVLDEGCLRWPETATADDIQAGAPVFALCPHCEHEHDSDAKDLIVREGIWTPGTWSISDEEPDGIWRPAGGFDAEGRVIHQPPRTVIRSGWLGALYSRDVSLAYHVSGMLRAKAKGEHRWRSWLNLSACKPYTVQSIALDASAIAEQATGAYVMGSLPTDAEHGEPEALLLTVDQQGNREDTLWFPWVLRAWWRGGRSMLVATGVVPSPGEAAKSGELGGLPGLSALLSRQWLIGSAWRSIDCSGTDNANGNLTWRLRQWAGEDPRRRILLNGDPRLRDGIRWQEMQPTKKQQRQIPNGVRIYFWHAQQFRDELYEAIIGLEHAPVWRIPVDVPAFYAASLTSEEKVDEAVQVVGKGREVRLMWRPRVQQTEDGRIQQRSDQHWWVCEAEQFVLADILGLLDSDTIEADEPPVLEGADDAELSGGWDTGAGDWTW